MIHIGKSHRADYLVHALRACPVLNGGEKRCADFGVVDEIDKTEASLPLT